MKKSLHPPPVIKNRSLILTIITAAVLLMTFQTVSAQYQFTSNATANNTSLPMADPNYMADGNFTVQVIDDIGCVSTTLFTVHASPIAGSGPDGSTPPLTSSTTYFGFPAGSFFFGNAGAGSYQVTVTETANNCTFSPDPVIYTVNVHEAALSCPDDIYVDADQGECGAIVDYAPYLAVGSVTQTYSFEFGGSVIDSGPGSGSGSFFQVGPTMVTLTGESPFGISSCTFLIFVYDHEAPVVTNAEELDWTFSCKGEVPAPNPDIIEFSDNCSPTVGIMYLGDIVTQGDCLHDYMIERVFILIGKDGNMRPYTQTLTVNDEEAPELVGTLPGGDVGNVCRPPRPPLEDDIAALYQDNCSGELTATLIDDLIDGDQCGWTVTFTYTVSDICGNTVTPVIVYTGGDTDAPGLESETYTCSSLDLNDLNWCYDAIEDFNPSDLEALVAGLYVDNCSVVTATWDGVPNLTGNDCAWVAVFAYIIEDECMHSVTCTVTYSGGDTEVPGLVSDALTCSSLDMTDLNWCLETIEDFKASDLETQVAGLYEDNCGVVTATWDEEAVITGDDCNWMAVFTFTIEDECMQSVSCTVTYSGGDTEAPGLISETLTASSLDLAELNWCYETIEAFVPATLEEDLAALYTDNCGTVSATWSDTDLVGNDCEWIATFTFTISDDCKNSASTTVTYSGGDTEAPGLISETLTCSSLDKEELPWCLAQVFDFNTAELAAEVADLYDDNCGTVSATLFSSIVSGNDCAWVVSFTFTISDDCNNSVSCTVHYSGGDTVPPAVVYCPADQTFDADEGLCNYTIKDHSLDPLFIDNCGFFVIVFPPVLSDIGPSAPNGVRPIGLVSVTYTLSGATTGTGISLVSVTFNVGVTDVFWTGTDKCGNVATCTFDVTVLPTSLSGVATYYNFFGDDIPMAGALVVLLGDDDSIIDMTSADNDGYYEFTDQDNLKDTRKVAISTNVAHGGLSATDALAVQRIATSLPVSYWHPENFLDEVGNVNVQGLGNGVNIIDAVRIIDRLLYPANPDFFFEDETQAEPRPLRDWTFYAPDLNLGQGVVFTYAAANAGTIDFALDYCELDIWGRTYGDVLGNYNPSFPAAPTKSANRLNTGEVMPVQPGAEFELPVRVTDGMEVSAMTLVMDYDADKLELTGVRSDLPGMRFVIEAGQVRIAWTQLDPVYLYPGDAAVRLVARTLTEVKQGDALLSLGALTGFAGADAIPVEDFELSVNSIDNTLTVTGIDTPSQYGVNLEAYPNPFRNELNLRYEIPEAATVRISIVNTLGARVALVTDHRHEAGIYNHVFSPDSESMEDGVYFIHFEVKGETLQTGKFIKLIYIR